MSFDWCCRCGGGAAPGYGGCCNWNWPEPPPCPCTEAGGQANQYSITIAGVVDDYCTNCDVLNDTFTVDALPNRPTHCEWRYLSSDQPCYGFPLLVQLTISDFLSPSSPSGPHSIGVYAGFGAAFFVLLFRREYEDQFNCGGLDNVDIPLFQSNYSFCDGSAATCTVSAI